MIEPAHTEVGPPAIIGMQSPNNPILIRRNLNAR